VKRSPSVTPMGNQILHGPQAATGFVLNVIRDSNGVYAAQLTTRPHNEKSPAARATLRRPSETEYRSGGFVFDNGLFAFGALAAARALGQGGLDFLHGFGLGHAMDGGNLAGQPVQSGFIKLTFAV